MKFPKKLKEKQDLKLMEKNRNCSVKNCSQVAIRSLSENKWGTFIEKAGLKIVENKNKKVYLCKNHYNKVKKIKKSQEKLYQQKGFLDDFNGKGIFF
ncbi:MAG: hypothetical protein ACTSXH_06065 [Promethearchaeota archaeon]